MTPSRRSFITGLISLVAAPAIVRVGSLMPVKVMGPMEPARWLTFAEVNARYGIGPASYALDDLVEYNGQLLKCVGSWVIDDLRLR